MELPARLKAADSDERPFCSAFLLPVGLHLDGPTIGGTLRMKTTC